MFEVINWPEDMKPSRSPIHFTNELEVAVAPETVWALLIDPASWPLFYPGVEDVTLPDGRTNSPSRQSTDQTAHGVRILSRAYR